MSFRDALQPVCRGTRLWSGLVALGNRWSDGKWSLCSHVMLRMPNNIRGNHGEPYGDIEDHIVLQEPIKIKLYCILHVKLYIT